jgi:predicted acylesterase/phospholipase RssA
VVQALLATAALPFGIVPAVEGAVDGGLADNLPLYPLTTTFPCDRLLIIRANAVPLEHQKLVERWSYIERLLWVVKYDMRSAPVTAVNERKEPPPEPIEPVRWPESFPEFRVISMDASPKGFLRDFIGGKMNFRASYARRQFGEGYFSMRARLKSDLQDFVRCRTEA